MEKGKITFQDRTMPHNILAKRENMHKGKCSERPKFFLVYIKLVLQQQRARVFYFSVAYMPTYILLVRILD